ncbi:hypothetical protein BCR37DRAFT_388123 [Protomyces lactucae-debilis]|uniref:Uncharacterized protein n=1 Tax=Protomyces lactucae-debilis TaxID=2754530 RepID=A0A1Y2F946_PROLT|nr:uncharacterized protein BCR37DRAFT_388123 [Protomyces lactucae-debilis]ORY80393.1 hypothetical protein BCR37DRAFT_388123 [Protomyces lactucae-debilis]
MAEFRYTTSRLTQEIAQQKPRFGCMTGWSRHKDSRLRPSSQKSNLHSEKRNLLEALEASRTFFYVLYHTLFNFTAKTLPITMQIIATTSLFSACLFTSAMAMALPAAHKHAASAHGITLVDSSFAQAQDEIVAFGTRPVDRTLSAVQFHNPSAQDNIISELDFHELVFGLK